MTKKVLLFLMLIIISTSITAQNYDAYLEVKNEESLTLPGIYARVETNKGVMIFYLDYNNTPLTVLNFINRVEEGFYNGLSFYRNVKNYAVFSGDSENTGLGEGGELFPMEINNVITHDRPGIISMDGISKMSKSEVFFISRTADSILDEKYTSFAFITEGLKTLSKIKANDKIIKIEIHRTGEEALAFNTDESEFKRLSNLVLKNDLEDFRAENPQLVTAIEELGENVQKTLTGIYYTITKEGNGVKAKVGDMVSVHYVGKLIDKTIFDSSVAREKPFEFSVGTKSVISGWDESVLSMTVGEKRTVIIPPLMAYGEVEAGPIAPNSWLIFEVEFVGIK